MKRIKKSNIAVRTPNPALLAPHLTISFSRINETTLPFSSYPITSQILYSKPFIFTLGQIKHKTEAIRLSITRSENLST